MWLQSLPCRKGTPSAPGYRVTGDAVSKGPFKTGSLLTEEPALRRVVRAHADSQLPRQDKLAYWRDRRRTAWPEHMRSGGGARSPLWSHTSKRSGPHGLLGCFETVPCFSPSPPLLLLLPCSEISRDRVSQLGVWGVPQLPFLTSISVPQHGSFTPAVQLCSYPSKRPGVLPFCVFCFPFLECLLPSSFLHSFLTFKVLTTPKWSGFSRF